MSNDESSPLDPTTRDEIVRRIQKRVLDDSAEEIAGLFAKHGIEAIGHAFYVFVHDGSSMAVKPTMACVIGILAYDDVITHGTPDPTREHLLAVCERFLDGDKEFHAFSKGYDNEDFCFHEAYEAIFDKGDLVRRLAFGE